MADVVGKTTAPSAERARLEDAREWDSPWRKWGPYVGERQWGTVRAGLGASHQTGWTALVGVLAQVFRTVDARTVFESDRKGFIASHGSTRV